MTAYSGQDVQYGHYHRGPLLCCAHIRQRTYEKTARTARAAKFLYHQLIDDNNMEDWTYIPSSGLLSRTFPADLNVKIISEVEEQARGQTDRSREGARGQQDSEA